MKKNTQILGGGLFRGLALYAVAVMPLVAFAQTSNIQEGYLGTLGRDVFNFINETLVPLVFALALVVFIWGLFMTFILGGSNPDKQKEGRDLMLWGIIAFFVMVSVWGLVNILTGITGIDAGDTPTIPTIEN
tara:strand:- start:305949 stop:306344 length:396 start_codon:yes stop_codon:yes gene_type:complete